MSILDISCEVPGLCDIETVREQFMAIWSKNTVEVDIIRNNNPQGGDYFHEDESVEPQTRKMWLNIQGTQSDYYRREKFGITTTESQYHAYGRWYEDIENNDRIVWGGKKFVIININKSMYAGQFVFVEFDLKSVDKG